MIDNEALHSLIVGHNRVCIMAPRRSGKTEFIRQFFERATDQRILYVTLTKRQSDEAVTHLKNNPPKKGTKVLCYSAGEFGGEETNFNSFDVVILDEGTYMCPLFIDNVMNECDKTIIAIGTEIQTMPFQRPYITDPCYKMDILKAPLLRNVATTAVDQC